MEARAREALAVYRGTLGVSWRDALWLSLSLLAGCGLAIVVQIPVRGSIGPLATLGGACLGVGSFLGWRTRSAPHFCAGGRLPALGWRSALLCAALVPGVYAVVLARGGAGLEHAQGDPVIALVGVSVVSFLAVFLVVVLTGDVARWLASGPRPERADPPPSAGT